MTFLRVLWAQVSWLRSRTLYSTIALVAAVAMTTNADKARGDRVATVRYPQAPLVLNITRAQPLGILFSAVADILHGMRLGDPDEVTASKLDTAYAHALRSVRDVPFLFAVSDMADSSATRGGRSARDS